MSDELKDSQPLENIEIFHEKGIIKEISIIQDSGLLLYYRSYQQQEKQKQAKDPVLFAAMMSALLTMSHEISEGINSIDMNDDYYYFLPFGKITFILKTSETLPYEILDRMATLNKKDPDFNAMIEKFSVMTVIPTDKESLKEYDELIQKGLTRVSLNIAVSKNLTTDDGELTLEELQVINQLLKDIQEGKLSESAMARELFMKTSALEDSKELQRYINLLKVLLKSDLPRPTLRKSLQEIIEILERSLKASNFFGMKYGDVVF